jgi:hypothetical protein
MNIWTLLLIGAGVIMASGLFALVCGVLRAPTGFQDGEGFHVGPEPERKAANPEVPLTLAHGAGNHFGHAA